MEKEKGIDVETGVRETGGRYTNPGDCDGSLGNL